ncbi:hypothetical protein HK102_003158, partial [Quaeritorhiza haematococci]
ALENDFNLFARMFPKTQHLPEDKLANLVISKLASKQHDRESTAKYLIRFQDVAARAELSDEDQHAAFLGNLHPAIRDYVANHNHTQTLINGEKSILDELTNFAKEAEQQNFDNAQHHRTIPFGPRRVGSIDAQFPNPNRQRGDEHRLALAAQIAKEHPAGTDHRFTLDKVTRVRDDKEATRNCPYWKNTVRIPLLYTPETDLFATATNIHAPKFITSANSPMTEGCLGLDAFTHPWHNILKPYLNPPWTHIPRAITSCAKTKSDLAIFIAPVNEKWKQSLETMS